MFTIYCNCSPLRWRHTHGKGWYVLSHDRAGSSRFYNVLRASPRCPAVTVLPLTQHSLIPSPMPGARAGLYLHDSDGRTALVFRGLVTLLRCDVLKVTAQRCLEFPSFQRLNDTTGSALKKELQVL